LAPRWGDSATRAPGRRQPGVPVGKVSGSLFERQKVVGVAGFEPATPSSRTRCATRLRYTPVSAGSPYIASGPAGRQARGTLIALDPTGIVRRNPGAAMGRSQVVRQRILIPPFGGSN